MDFEHICMILCFGGLGACGLGLFLMIIHSIW